ncbi:MAG TPA: molecular chaperone TorD family protein [Desulfitobacterium dehalogenans]|uniref:Molecular chaperone TorD family protein n=1 Tax=Desulfitobacterium dehalogenans TaxID=36854 RepID=A0A7C7DAF3_9FIRM|nr:molecular chaperone TorD family protein [Desulfitobacterium dehalogenans]
MKETTQNDTIAILLANRHYLYGLLQHTFGNEPSIQLFKAVTGEHTRDALQLWLNEESDLSDYLSLLNEVKIALNNDWEETLEHLKSEYTFLFIGPNRLPAPPWESVYRSEERMIFQESTLRVRRAYLEYGFLPSNYPHEADDHLAIELDFMVHLSKLALERFEEEKYEDTQKILSSQKEFLEEHLLVWIKDFSREIQNSKTHYFYPQLAALTEKILQMDKVVVQEIMGAI